MIRTVLEQYPASINPSTEAEALGNAGGLSGASLWKFSAGARTLVARAWPNDGAPRHVLEQIHAWLIECRRLSFIPTPLPTRDGRTLVEVGGRLWEVAPWMDGIPDLNQPALPRVRAAFRGLAAFHQILTRHRTAEPSPGVRARLDEVDAGMRGGFARLREVIERAPDDAKRRLALRWIDAATRAATGVRSVLVDAVKLTVMSQPCLRDARPEHFLFQGDSLTGLIDFGAMGRDSVAADLARLISEWLADDRELRDQAFAAYASVRPVDVHETALVAVFEQSAALLTGSRWATWHFLESRTFEDPLAVVRGLEKGVERVERLLR